MQETEYEKTFVVDTSVILDDVNSLFILSQNGKNRIIIPETTLDELDSKKKGWDDVNFQAREFNRILDEAVTVKEYDIPLSNNKLSVVAVKINDCIVELVSKDKYSISSHNENHNIVNDRKILEIAKHFEDAIMVSNDIAMRIRARSMKIHSEPLKISRYEQVEKIDFIEKIHISSKQIEYLEDMSPVDFGKDLSFYTNVEFICDDTGHSILAFYKQDNKFHIIDEKRLRRLSVKPRNKEQIFFLNMLLDKDLPIVVCAGVTGSGKNLLSLQGAVKYSQNLSKSNFGIKYCRNSVTAGDPEAQLGFLKGDENSKLNVFSYPLYDSIGAFLEIEQEEAMKDKKNIPTTSIKEFMDDYNIQVVNINQMRGTNLNGYLIFDEWQNSSASVNKLMLTRVVEGSKVVIIGDLNQIDHPHLSKYNNALAIMLKHAKYSDLVGGITMTKVVRGRIAAFADSNL